MLRRVAGLISCLFRQEPVEIIDLTQDTDSEEIDVGDELEIAEHSTVGTRNSSQDELPNELDEEERTILGARNSSRDELSSNEDDDIDIEHPSTGRRDPDQSEQLDGGNESDEEEEIIQCARNLSPDESPNNEGEDIDIVHPPTRRRDTDQSAQVDEETESAEAEETTLGVRNSSAVQQPNSENDGIEILNVSTRRRVNSCPNVAKRRRIVPGEDGSAALSSEPVHTMTIEAVSTQAEPIGEEVQLTCDPPIIPSNPVTHPICSVCFQNSLSNDPTTILCGHVFCGPCLREWLAKEHRCPLCRARASFRGSQRLFF